MSRKGGHRAGSGTPARGPLAASSPSILFLRGETAGKAMRTSSALADSQRKETKGAGGRNLSKGSPRLTRGPKGDWGARLKRFALDCTSGPAGGGEGQKRSGTRPAEVFRHPGQKKPGLQGMNTPKVGGEARTSGSRVWTRGVKGRKINKRTSRSWFLPVFH